MEEADTGAQQGDEGNQAKNFLYQWLGRNKVVPQYNVRNAGTKQRQRFLCELFVEGFPYRAAGNSTSKKDAQTNAAKDFIQFLIRSNKLDRAEVPPTVLAFQPSAPEAQIPPSVDSNFHRPVFAAGQGPWEMGEGYRPHAGGRPGPDFNAINAEKMAEAESLDVNASLHGNWTIENAKSRLHQFLQTNNIKTDYNYASIGPAHAKNFQCEMHFFVKQLGRGIQARETGSNKQTSSKSCALSLVRQLYHLKVIEAFGGITKRQREAEEALRPYKVSIDPKLSEEVRAVLTRLNITSLSVPAQSQEFPQDEGEPTDIPGFNLLPEIKNEVSFLHTKEETANFSVVSWSPPVPNWNPWTANNIDEGHMASASLEQLSDEFLQSFREVQQTSSHYQELFSTRSKLPIFEARDKIMAAIYDSPIILIKGDTGCGKTTQICQFLLDDNLLAGSGAFCNIVITQPRRISAISVAERVAAERAEDLGQTVGYSVRFESCLPRPYASILFCTVGVLLRKLEAGLRGVSHVIVDEIHERDVNTDFLLVVLRDMLSIYPDLRVILMSATIDDTLFTQYFNGCPVLTVEGRAFPVQTFFLEDIVEQLQFQPSPDSIRNAKRNKKDDDEEVATEGPEENLNILPPGSGYSEGTRRAMSLMNERDVNLELLVSLLSYINEMQSGQDYKSSVLIFLPGWNIIFLVLKYLMSHPVFGSQSFSILPLHSQLPREDQHRVFAPVPQRITKIILSTNIAETSITIDDVGFVIDACKAKTKLFTSHNNMTTFVTMWASKSNLLQRRGRAGRVQEGMCFHLCSKARFERLEENMVPEMFRTPLHEIALMIKLLRLGGIAHFLSKAPEPPPLDAVIEAIALLLSLKCLDDNGELTGLGTILAKLPLDPRLGKMIVLGIIFGCADPLAIIAANSSNMNEVFNLGLEAKRLHPVQRSFAANKNSDHFALLNAFQQWSHFAAKNELAEVEFCQQRMLSLPSLRMTKDAKNQLLQVLSAIGFPDDQLTPLKIQFREDSIILDRIAVLLVAGLYPNICFHKEKRKVLTTESKAALIHKASVNCSKFEVEFPYPFFVFGEKIRTRAVSCKQMTNISPIHLLLFGARKVEVFPQNVIRLDNWMNLEMNPEDVEAILSLRAPIESMICRASEDPEGFFPLAADDEALVAVVSDLSRLYAARYGQEENQAYLKSRPTPRDNFQHMQQQQAEQEYYAEYDANPDEMESELNWQSESGARGLKRNFAGEDPGNADTPDTNVSFGNSPPPAKRGFYGGPGTGPTRMPSTPRGGFNPVNKFSPQGYSPAGASTSGPRGVAFSQRGSGQSPRGGRFGGPRYGSGATTGGFNNPGNFGATRFQSSGFEPRQKFFNSNRGGWSARGNAPRGSFRGRFSPRPRPPRGGGGSAYPTYQPQPNYPY